MTVDPSRQRVNLLFTGVIPTRRWLETALWHKEIGPIGSPPPAGTTKGREMSRFTTFHRAAATVGASGLIALSLAGPAAARPDPGTGSQQEFRCTNSCFSGGDTQQQPRPITVPRLDESGVEYVQLGAGLVAGLALAGAGVAFASRRSHAHAHAAHAA